MNWLWSWVCKLNSELLSGSQQAPHEPPLFVPEASAGRGKDICKKFYPSLPHVFLSFFFSSWALSSSFSYSRDVCILVMESFGVRVYFFWSNDATYSNQSTLHQTRCWKCIFPSLYVSISHNFETILFVPSFWELEDRLSRCLFIPLEQIPRRQLTIKQRGKK